MGSEGAPGSIAAQSGDLVATDAESDVESDDDMPLVSDADADDARLVSSTSGESDGEDGDAEDDRSETASAY